MSHATVVLVRHGSVEGIEQPRFRGRQHLQLTGAGLREAERSAAVIARRHRPDLILTSPLTRCVTTGAVIGQALGLAPEPDEGLIDIDYGEWQGRLQSEVREADPKRAAAWFEDPATAPVPGGETLRELSERVVAAFERVAARIAGGTAVIVGHDTVNRVILLHALGLDLSHYWRLRQDPACLNVLWHEENGWVLHSLNETVHLLPSRSDAPMIGARA